VFLLWIHEVTRTDYLGNLRNGMVGCSLRVLFEKIASKEPRVVTRTDISWAREFQARDSHYAVHHVYRNNVFIDIRLQEISCISITHEQQHNLLQ